MRTYHGRGTIMDSHHKHCPACNEVKPRSAFSKMAGSSDGLQGRCKSCFRIYQRARKYGLSEKHFRLLLESQDYECAICGKPDRNLVVDHNHNTGKVRGLLCNSCNVGIGHLQDSVLILNRAVGYLLHD